jgi:glycosyltransferase involved in cell wall biosynthesis
VTIRPVFIPSSIRSYWQSTHRTDGLFGTIRNLYAGLSVDKPEVSIVIPAYNEEANIVRTLLSLCSNKTSLAVEIIVVDNNSSDATAELVRSCGIPCIAELTQGITPARNKGLSEARGTYVLNADADSIYPASWIDDMVLPLKKDRGVALTYGTFSFIPTGATGRPVLFLYEYMADFSRMINRVFKDEAVNVYGFNSGFRREQGLSVGGFNHPPGTNEDGWLALKLRNKGYGKLQRVNRRRSLVWTTDRRIQIDGGLIRGTIKRLKRMVSNYFKSAR